jgi:hypothetical protein
MMSRKQVIKSIKQLAWASGSNTSTTVPASLESFRAHGVTIICGNDEFRGYVSSFKKACDAILDEYVQLARKQPQGLGLGKENGYRELVNKDLGRYDLNLDHLIKDHHQGGRKFTSNEIDITQCQAKVLARITPVLSAILGHQFIANAFGAVTSRPDTAPQNWHVDSSHLYNAADWPNGQPVLPCHFTTVFFPLYAFSEEIGPTEMAIGTHLYTGRLMTGHVSDQYPAEPTVKELLGQDGVNRIIVDAEPGDIGEYAYISDMRGSL